MQTSVTFKNIDSSENLRSYVADKLDRFDKYLYNPAEASVVLSVEKFRHIAEININGDRLNIQGKEETEDMYSAIDMVLDKLEKQIKKSKEKLSDKRSGARYRAKAGLTPETISVEEDFEKQITTYKKNLKKFLISLYHKNNNLSESFDKEKNNVSAKHLTWSYSSYLFFYMELFN